MRTMILFLALLFINNVIAQDNSISKYFNVRFIDIKAEIPEKQEYDIKICLKCKE